MTSTGALVTWLALLASAWTSGLFAARWREEGAGYPPWGVVSAFTAGALVAVTWAMLAGAALRGDLSYAAVGGRIVVDATAGYRLAAVLTGTSGLLLTAALVLAMALIVEVEGQSSSTRRQAGRLVTVLSGGLTLLLAAIVLVAPPFARELTAPPGIVPLSILHPGAALQPLLQVAAIMVSAVAVALVIAERAGSRAESRSGEVPPRRAEETARRLLVTAWILATLALASDEWARTALASTGAGAAGRNATGILLWLMLGAAAHRRVRGWIWGSRPEETGRSVRWNAHLAHAGAICLLLAFGAHVAARRVDVALPPGRTVDVGDALGGTWHLVNQGVSRFDAPGRDVTALAVEVSSPAGTNLLAPELRDYRGPLGEYVGAPVGARAVQRGALQDLLLTLDSVGEGDTGRVRVAFIPLASLWIPGIALLVAAALGALLSGSAVSAAPVPSSRMLP